MQSRFKLAAVAAGSAVAAIAFTVAVSADRSPRLTPIDAQNVAGAEAVLAEGRNTFRYDTFDDDAFWGGTLRLHHAIKGSRFGGVARA